MLFIFPLYTGKVSQKKLTRVAGLTTVFDLPNGLSGIVLGISDRRHITLAGLTLAAVEEVGAVADVEGVGATAAALSPRFLFCPLPEVTEPFSGTDRRDVAEFGFRGGADVGVTDVGVASSEAKDWALVILGLSIGEVATLLQLLESESTFWLLALLEPDGAGDLFDAGVFTTRCFS